MFVKRFLNLEYKFNLSVNLKPNISNKINCIYKQIQGKKYFVTEAPVKILYSLYDH